MAADGEELFALWHVDAGGDGDFGGVEGEVEASAGGFFEPVAGPPGGHAGFVGRLVGAEADVAVDAHHGFLRWADVLGGEVEHGFVDGGEEGEHGGFEGGLVEGLARLEPFAVVIALEAAEEF